MRDAAGPSPAPSPANGRGDPVVPRPPFVQETRGCARCGGTGHFWIFCHDGGATKIICDCAQPLSEPADRFLLLKLAAVLICVGYVLERFVL